MNIFSATEECFLPSGSPLIWKVKEEEDADYIPSQDDSTTGNDTDTCNPNLDVSFTTCQRGNKLLLYQGCKFSLERLLLNDITRWRCYRKTCAARLKYSKKEHKVVEVCDAHNHEAMAPKMLTRQRMSTVANIIGVDNLSEQPGHVLGAVLAAENLNLSQSLLGTAPWNRATDERARKKREWYKKYKERMKSDPVLLEKRREKERERYKMKLEKKQVKLVRDMTAREHRVQKLKWRKKSRQAYARRKQKMAEEQESSVDKLRFPIIEESNEEWGSLIVVKEESCDE